MATFTGNILERPNDFPLPADRYPTRYLAGWGIEWDFYWNGNTQSFTSWNTEWDTDWNSATGGYYLRKNKINEFESETQFGSFSDRQPYLTTRKNIVGYLAGAFSDQFYERIVIEPLFIDFGSLTGDAREEFVVWSAFFENSVLQTIGQNGFDSGLEFSGEVLPRTFLPLEEETYSVDASLDGPITIDASLVFTFPTPILSEISVLITGSRIVFLPVMYRDGMVEKLEWDTDIMNSYNGTEQRVKNRVSPRQFFNINGFIPACNMRNFENLLYGWRSRFWAVPVWQEVRVGSDITPGESIINVDTRYGDFREDSLVGIWKDFETFDIIQAIGITDNTISFDRSINTEFIDPLIFPVRLARMAAAPNRNTSAYSAVISVNLQVTDNIALDIETVPEQYLGDDVFVEIPESKDGHMDDKYETRIDLVDFSTGALSQQAPWTSLRINRTFTMIKEGLEEIWNFRCWLHRRSGRLRPFWMPTFEQNMELLSENFIADNFYITPDSYASQSSARENIIIFMNDGTHHIKKIVIINTDDPTKTNIGLDDTLDVYAEDIDYISFIGLKRLATDKVSVEWKANNVAIFTVPTKEIQP